MASYHEYPGIALAGLRRFSRRYDGFKAICLTVTALVLAVFLIVLRLRSAVPPVASWPTSIWVYYVFVYWYQRPISCLGVAMTCIVFARVDILKATFVRRMRMLPSR